MLEFLCGAREWVEDEIQGQNGMCRSTVQKFMLNLNSSNKVQMDFHSFPVLSKPCYSMVDQGFSVCDDIVSCY